MPKSSRKAGARKGRADSQKYSQADITLAEFADASSPKSGRMRKGTVDTATISDVKGTSSSEVMGGLSWFEKSDVDLEEELEMRVKQNNSPDREQDLAEPELPSSPVKKIIKEEDDHGMVYPLDMWFLIGRFVAPENVRTFGAICWGANTVTHSAQFWRMMYHRMDNSSYDLPDELQADFMEKVHGLRTRVVRSLFYTYPPYIERVKGRFNFESDGDCLEGAQCILMWHQKVNSNWHFYFKFFWPTGHVATVEQRRYLSRWECDTSYNRDERCPVLEVITKSFLSLTPAVMGQVLHKSLLSVGHGMRYHKLKLVFTSQRLKCTKTALACGTTIVLEPALNMRVLYWWDPKYPYNTI